MPLRYSGVHISSDEVFCKILKKPSIVQKKMIPHMKAKVVFIGKKQKNQNGWLKKSLFSSSANSQYFFVKISWIGPLVSRIDWCKGHWRGLTYMVRLSDISSKTDKKCIFCVFRLKHMQHSAVYIIILIHKWFYHIGPGCHSIYHPYHAWTKEFDDATQASYGLLGLIPNIDVSDWSL